MKWEKVKLGDIADFCNGLNFDKSAYSSGIKLVGVSNFGNRFSPDFSELSEVSAEVVREADLLKDGDIVFVRSNGNKELVGRCMLIAEVTEPVTYSGFVIRCRIHTPQKYDPVFFTYHFKNKAFRQAMAGTAVGANIQNLSQGRLSSYVANVPDTDSQHRIAGMLSAYDDLIENNQRQIKLLEEAAQRLYKEWFIDLRFPGYESTSIHDGIPEGWEKCAVSDFGIVITGKTPSTENVDYFGGEIPFVKIPDMHQGIFPVETETHLSSIGADTQKNKYIPKNSIMVSCIATVGLVNISVESCQTNQQINSVVLNDEHDLYYLYFALNDIKSILEGVGSNGATMTNVNKAKFSNLPIVKPTLFLRNRFYSVSKPVFDDILTLTIENKKLIEARDRLLPKLMSGEIEACL